MERWKMTLSVRVQAFAPEWVSPVWFIAEQQDFSAIQSTSAERGLSIPVFRLIEGRLKREAADNTDMRG